MKYDWLIGHIISIRRERERENPPLATETSRRKREILGSFERENFWERKREQSEERREIDRRIE